jgi:hypothetical protein
VVAGLFSAFVCRVFLLVPLRYFKLFLLNKIHAKRDLKKKVCTLPPCSFMAYFFEQCHVMPIKMPSTTTLSRREVFLAIITSYIN